MRLTYLQLENFRNHAKTVINLSRGINVFSGLNGQGKTNLVEALFFLSFGRSHRTSNNSALIRSRSGEAESDINSAYVRLELKQNERNILIETEIKTRGANQFFLNKQAVTAKEIQRVIPVVMFSPEDLDIARDDPAARRKFIDDLLSTRYPASHAVLKEYERAVKQRNSLLKSIRENGHAADYKKQIFAWDAAVADLGSQIMFHRRQTLGDLQQPLENEYRSLTNETSIVALEVKESLYTNVSRETSDSKQSQNVSRETIKADFLEALSVNYQQDVLKTQTTVGPHRDDLFFELNNLPVKGFASHGETWSFILSLRLAAARLIAQESYIGDPLLILDDVFAELDRQRQEKLYESIKDYEQVIITSASESDISMIGNKKMFHVKHGVVAEVVNDEPF